ncbi:MAG: nucleoside-diphosphate kinase [Acidobacteria bacterium]|nr:nucleoside-diphosphate kinase [Acidobacteriota bacterium]MDW7983340.1 nucleoside-diphosphate kinase [Acidobacteriota bacterium]
MRQQTLAIIKPDAVQRGLVGAILQRLEEEGFRIRALKMVHLTKAQAEAFYIVHRERPFYDSLMTYMSSGPVVVLVLERDDAIDYLRQVMGATDPAKAAPNTIRRLYGTNIERNAIHGSDSPESAAFEIPFFFSRWEIFQSSGAPL